jgi:hypothetical protein
MACRLYRYLPVMRMGCLMSNQSAINRLKRILTNLGLDILILCLLIATALNIYRLVLHIWHLFR